MNTKVVLFDTLATSADVTQTMRKIKYIRVFYFTFDTLIQFVSLYPALGIRGRNFCPYNCYFEFKISFLIYGRTSTEGRVNINIFTCLIFKTTQILMRVQISILMYNIRKNNKTSTRTMFCLRNKLSSLTFLSICQ